MRNLKGFALIELLLVIVILGVPAAAIIQNPHEFFDEFLGREEVLTYTIIDRVTGQVYHTTWYSANDGTITFDVDGKTITLSGGWIVERPSSVEKTNEAPSRNPASSK